MKIAHKMKTEKKMLKSPVADSGFAKGRGTMVSAKPV